MNYFLSFLFLCLCSSAKLPAHAQLSQEPEFTNPILKENWLEWRLLQTLKDTLLPAYITPQTEDNVQHWLNQVHKFKSDFSQANDHVLRMDQATRAHDIDTANAEAKAAADILDHIPWKPYDDGDSNGNNLPPLAPQRPGLTASISEDFTPTSPDVDLSFLNAVQQAWQQLPQADTSVLRAHGVKVNVVTVLQKEASGSPGIFDPTTNTIAIGQKGLVQNPNMQLSSINRDPSGTLQHEAGHALYKSLGLDKWNEFQNQYAQESARIPKDPLGLLAHFTGQDGPSEVFAELYAGIQGRTTDRVNFVKQAFPQTSKLVESRFQRNR